MSSRNSAWLRRLAAASCSRTSQGLHQAGEAELLEGGFELSHGFWVWVEVFGRDNAIGIQ